MKRSRLRWIRVLLTVGVCAVLAAADSGCSLLSNAIWMATDGKDTPAEYKKHDGLSGKRVAVVCRAAQDLSLGDHDVPRNLAKLIGQKLQANVAKLRLVSQAEVEDWADNDPDLDYGELREKLRADVVVGVDLASFSLQQDPTVYLGQADILIRVYDVADGGQMTWDKSLPAANFPSTGPEPPTGPEGPFRNKFRRQFAEVLADEIARLFYAHDSREDFARSLDR